MTRNASRIFLGLLLATAAHAKDPQGDGLADAPTVHCNEIQVSDGLAYVAQTSALSILDITDPSVPRAVGSLGIPATLTGIGKEGTLLCLAAGSHGLYLADVEDPAAPRLLQRFDTPGRVGGVEVRNGIAYLSDDRNGLLLVNVTNPERPIQRAKIPTRDTMRGFDLRGDWLATAEGDAGARLFKLRRDGRPDETASLHHVRGARDVALLDGLLLVAAGKRGLLVYSLETSKPVLRATVEPLRSADYVSAEGSTAVVSNGTAGLQFLDLTDPGKPREMSTLKIHRNYPTGRVSLAGPYVYVAVDLAGMAVVDLGEPEAPELAFPRQKRKLKISFPQAD